MRDAVAEAERQLGYSLGIMQGAYNSGGVAASAGTHDGGGVFDSRNYSWTELTVMRKIGIIAWKRTPSQGFVFHNHSVIRGCPHLSSGAAYQQSEFVNYRHNGLAGRGRDDGPAVDVPRWSTYQAARQKAIKKAQDIAAEKAAKVKALNKKLLTYTFTDPKTKKKLPGITAVRLIFIAQNRASGGKGFSRHVYVVQGWLVRLHFLEAKYRDGRWGPVTQKAYDKFRAKHWADGRTTGAPGLGSVQRLGALVKTKYPIKAN